MFTAEDAAAKVIQAREAAQIKEEEKRKAEEKKLEGYHRLAEERLPKVLAKVFEAIEEAAGEPSSTLKYPIGHRSGAPDFCKARLTELVMEKLRDLNYQVRDTSSDAKEDIRLSSFKPHVWRYELTISW